VINPDMGEDLIITVIATGFEREAEAAAIGSDRAPARSTKPSQAVLAGVGAAAVSDRPIKDIDRPTFLRRMNDVRESIDRAALAAEDEWDVPTFLRKQAD
jgi:cell division protein FtsZ